MSDSVPVGWESRRLGDIGIFKTSSVDKKTRLNEQVVSLVNYMDVYRNNIISPDYQFQKVTANKNQTESSNLTKGDILFTPSSETPDDIGHSAVVVDELERTLHSYHLVRFRLNNQELLDLHFRGYVFRANYIMKQFYLGATGSTRFTLSIGDFSKIRVIFPSPLPEQQKIASILTSVDTVIEKTQSQINKLKDLKKAMMQELLTKGIGHTEFKDSPVGRIPKSWEVKPFNEVVTSIRSGLSRRIISQDIGIPVLISGNIQNGKLDTSELKYWYVDDPQGANTNNYILDDGDILLCFINSISQIGKSCIFHDIGRPAIYTTNMFRIIPKRNYPSVFLHLVMNADGFQREIELITKPAVNQASFTKVDLEAIEVIVPSIKEIQEITCAISSIDTNIDEKQRKLNHTKSLKKALMQDLLTGKVRVKV